MNIISKLFPGQRIVKKRSLTGGDINQTSYIQLDSHLEIVMKYNPQPPPKVFEIEAKSLLQLSQNGLPVPEVLGYDEEHLILKYYPPGYANPAFETQAGESLARLHLTEPKPPGLDFNNYIGTLPQSNKPYNSWVQFFIYERILPQLNLAKQANLTQPEELKIFSKFIKILPNLIPEMHEGPLLHGDIWKGNVMALQDNTVLFIDPAIYYGSPEMDLAFSQMFYSFGNKFYEAYHSIKPIEKEFSKRKDIYNIYPQLCHTNLFSNRTYLNTALNTIQQYL